ncbi:2-succinyl-6-hydroxy-2,4-cyclohexadiene-1-carboxylate synthase [Oceanobacillus sp. CAU 1775]
MYFSTNGTDYRYQIIGEGTPIIFLHGFTGTSATWENFINNPTPGMQFIVIDMPGHGKTSGDRLVTMEDFCHDLHQFIKYLNLEKVYLVGYSMGGRAALSYATSYPESLYGVVLESASPGLSTEEERAQRVKADEKLIEKIKSQGIEAFVDFWENIPLFDSQLSLAETVQEKIRKERLSQTEAGLIQSLKGMGTGAQNSNWDKLFSLQFPVLLVVGSLDEKFVAINEQMAEWIPNVTTEIFFEAGHAVHLEKPELFKECILGFANYHTS